MNIEQALKIKVGDYISYPSDMGKSPGRARVKYMPQNPIINKNLKGVEYIWVCTENGVWPSNRLGR